MNVVFHAANGMDKDVLVLANAGGVCPKAFLHLRWNDFPPLFCAVNDVHYILKIGMRQGVAPPYPSVRKTGARRGPRSALRILKQLSPSANALG